MSELKHIPVKHDHSAFLAKAAQREGFSEAYASLELEYQVVNQLLKARTKAGQLVSANDNDTYAPLALG